jgi:hypothetical protein
MFYSLRFVCFGLAFVLRRWNGKKKKTTGQDGTGALPPLPPPLSLLSVPLALVEQVLLRRAQVDDAHASVALLFVVLVLCWCVEGEGRRRLFVCERERDAKDGKKRESARVNKQNTEQKTTQPNQNHTPQH